MQREGDQNDMEVVLGEQLIGMGSSTWEVSAGRDDEQHCVLMSALAYPFSGAVETPADSVYPVVRVCLG